MPHPRSHHYVPEFHLAQVVGLPFRRFWAFDKRWGKTGRRPVASSAVSRDYYALPGQNEEDRLALEREFAALENQVAPLIKWLAECHPGRIRIGDGHRDALAGYAATLHIRVPAARDAALARARAIASDPESLGLADAERFLKSARDFGLVGSDSELDAQRRVWLEELREGRRGFTVHPAISLTGLGTATEKVRPMLLDREWELLRTEGWPGFVLGDQPVTLLSGGRIAPQIGFGTSGVQVMMPLSPDTLLLISDRPRESHLEMKLQGRLLGLAEPWWATANRVAWLTSKRYVFGQTRLDLQAGELLLHPDDRRRDIHHLSADDAVAAIRRSRRRRQQADGSSFDP